MLPLNLFTADSLVLIDKDIFEKNPFGDIITNLLLSDSSIVQYEYNNNNNTTLLGKHKLTGKTSSLQNLNL